MESDLILLNSELIATSGDQSYVASNISLASSSTIVFEVNMPDNEVLWHGPIGLETNVAVYGNSIIAAGSVVSPTEESEDVDWNLYAGIHSVYGMFTDVVQSHEGAVIQGAGEIEELVVKHNSTVIQPDVSSTFGIHTLELEESVNYIPILLSGSEFSVLQLHEEPDTNGTVVVMHVDDLFEVTYEIMRVIETNFEDGGDTWLEGVDGNAIIDSSIIYGYSGQSLSTVVDTNGISLTSIDSTPPSSTSTPTSSPSGTPTSSGTPSNSPSPTPSSTPTNSPSITPSETASNTATQSGQISLF